MGAKEWFHKAGTNFSNFFHKAENVGNTVLHKVSDVANKIGDGLVKASPIVKQVVDNPLFRAGVEGVATYFGGPSGLATSNQILNGLDSVSSKLNQAGGLSKQVADITNASNYKNGNAVQNANNAYQKAVAIKQSGKQLVQYV